MTSSLSTLSAASAMAGAVFLAEGSRINSALGRTEATPAAWSLPATTSGGANRLSSATRAAVWASIDPRPARSSICFGRARRDNGHSLVPDPPERMTGTTRRFGPALMTWGFS